MDLSYWEREIWFSNVDYVVVGSGIVGLNAALRLREKYPESKILVLEKGALPEGASTKNAGFACFGSLSEIISDLRTHSEEEVVNLVAKRWEGLSLLRQQLGDAAIDFKPYGGYEIFLKDDPDYRDYLGRIPYVNEVLKPLFRNEVFGKQVDRFGFGNIEEEVVFNPFEGQIDTGKAMLALLRKAVLAHILILNHFTVTGYVENSDGVQVVSDDFSFRTGQLLFATNAFAARLTDGAVQPGRAQVLITKPLSGLDLKGTFHLDHGYYYFRNVGDRILIGGGRNLDFDAENTTVFGLTEIVQQRLEKLLKEVILPDTPFEIDHRWSGIMGLGHVKSPIVERLSDRVCCGVRLGGMGVAIGSQVGKELADLV